MGNVGRNSPQAEIEKVHVIIVSAPIELFHTIHFSIFVFRNFVVIFKETETAQTTCAWGMVKKITEPFGNPNSFGEYCCTRTHSSHRSCHHDGCDAKVHKNCQIFWLKHARLPADIHGPIYCPTHNRQRGDYIKSYYESKGKAIPPSLLLTTSENVTMPLLNSGTSPGLNGVARNHNGEGNQARLGSTADAGAGEVERNSAQRAAARENRESMFKEESIPDGTGLTMGNVGRNSSQAEIEKVRVIIISAPIELYHTIHFSIFVFRNFVVIFKETETAPITCAWGMEKKIMVPFGNLRNTFGEYCCTHTHRGQVTCHHDGCDAKVHRNCQYTWLNIARLPVDIHSPLYCPTHNRQRGDYIKSYYESKGKAIPPSLLLTTSENVKMPLLNSGTSPGLNGVARNCNGEDNQARLGSTADSGAVEVERNSAQRAAAREKSDMCYLSQNNWC